MKTKKKRRKADLSLMTAGGGGAEPRPPLKIRQAMSLPLDEISGLCLRKMQGRRELLAIGDESHVVVAAELDAGGLVDRVRLHDLRSLLSAESHGAMGSEWEAIAADGEGRVFVLQERPGKVFVLDAGLGELLHVIDLDIDNGEGPACDWLADENSRGEGLVLLANGHLLLVKEKRPALLVELGPRGDRAQGVTPARLTPAAVPLPGARRVAYAALQAWRLTGDDHLEDLSDIAVWPGGDLYMISDEERCLIQASAELPAEGGAVRVIHRWELPKKVKNPEGLVILEDGSPVVAVDRKGERDNLFLLEASEEP